MSGRAARLLIVAWGTAYVVCLSWPGLLPFNRIEPKVLGMPFVMAFVAGWLVLGLIVLIIVDRAVSRDEYPGGDGAAHETAGHDFGPDRY